MEASPAQSGGAVAVVGDRDGQAASRTFVDRAVAQSKRPGCAGLYCGASFTESCGLIKVRWERLWTDEEEPGGNVACTSFQCFLEAAVRR